MNPEPVRMAARLIPWRSPAPGKGRRRWGLTIVLVLAIVSITLAGLSWWVNEPLDEPRSGVASDSQPSPPVAVARRDTMPEWPESRLEGVPAKTLLLETLLAVQQKLDWVKGYTATFRKQERINGALGPEQTLAMKVRHRPFAVYFKFLSPHEGKEVVYAEGHHENKVIAHSGGVARFLVPRLAVPPTHPIALADSRHPVTEAGLANLTRRLIGFRRLDLQDAEAVTILDRITDETGRSRLRSIHLHPHRHPDRPFARVEVLYDPVSHIPLQISSYEWPDPEHQDEFPLAERYTYENLDLDAELTALDFDPANPAYAFHRY
jgi:hypothetical protein